MEATDPFAGIGFGNPSSEELPNTWGNRVDGTPKGPGYLGTLKSKSGNDMTEYSIGVNIDGEEMEIPTIVDGLSPEEIEYLKTEPRELPKELIDKAVTSARQRKAQGKSVFKETEEADPFSGVGFGDTPVDPFAGMSVGGQDVKVAAEEGAGTVGSTVERNGEEGTTGEPSYPELLKAMGSDVLSAGKRLGSEYLDIQNENFKTLFTLGGPAKVALSGIETLNNFGAGAISWTPSKIGLVAQTAFGKALQADDWAGKKSEFNLSDADVARMAENVEQAIGNVLPSIIGEPKTELGQRQTKFLGDVFETALAPLKTAAAFYKEQGWPNFGNMLALSGELLAFKALHKGSGIIKDKVFKEKIQAVETPADMAEVVKEFRKEAIIEAEKNAKLLDVISPERAALAENARRIKLEEITNDPTLSAKEKLKLRKEIKKESKDAKKEAKESLENFKNHQALIDEAKKNNMSLEELIQDRLEKNQKILDSTEQMSDFALKEIQQKEVELSKSELSQGSRGFSGEGVRRPDLGAKAVSGLKTETGTTTPEPKATVEFLSDEGIPRATYQIENGKLKEVETIGEKKVWKIDPVTKGIELVENIPGQKQVWKVTLDSLKNQSGAVDLDLLMGMFGKAPKGGNLINSFLKKGMSKEDLILSGIGGYLAEKGQKPVDWNEIKKLADEGGFDVRKESLNNSIYSPGTHQKLNLSGMKEGTYSENLYKYAPDTSKQKQYDNVDKLYETNQITANEWRTRIAELNKQDFSSDYNEPHWAEHGRNVMAHDRRHERTVETEKGSKEVVYVDEIQSNWHRDGQREGYGAKVSKYKAIFDKVDVAIRYDLYGQIHKEVIIETKRRYSELQAKGKMTIDEYYTAKDALTALGNAPRSVVEPQVIPNAPFKKTWPEMIMRDVIADAVNKGKDGIAWSTGKIQVARGGGKEASKRDAIYDKHVPQFFEREFGVKPEKQITVKKDAKEGYSIIETYKGEFEIVPLAGGRAVKIFPEGTDPKIVERYLKDINEYIPASKKEQVWYVPITNKMRKMYSESAQTKASIFEQLIEPLRNQDGFIEIPGSREKLLEKTSQAFRENVRRFGAMAEKADKPMAEFLKDNNFSDKEIKQMVKVAEAVKLESPFKSPKSDTVISEGKDPLKLQPGEVNVNTGKKANPKTVIGDKFFEGIRKATDVKLPKILEAITPALHTIKDMKSSEMLDMWHKVKEIEGNRLKDIKILKDTTLALRDKYPKRKLREEAFVKIMSQDKLGREALVMLDIKPIDGPIKYEGLVGELNGQFKDLFNQLNTMRESIGKNKIAERTSYLPMIAQENFYSQMKQLFKGQEGEINHPNMVLDSVQAIQQRHSPQAVEATALRHLKRRGLRKGVKLETDPLKLLAQYGSTAYKHIHYSPFNMFVNQLTTGKFKVKNSTGKEFDWQMANQKPELHEFLSRWSNALAGKPNLMHGPALRFLESGAQKLSSNLTAAVLGWSARTILVQPTALLPTATEFGVTPTVKGLMRTAMRSKKDPINRSQELPNRIADASMSRDITSQLKNPVMRALSLPAEKALSGMKFVDYVVAEATWRTAFESSKHLGESTAIRLADEAVVRTQGSGFVGDLSPIQMNALGKAVTLWQTFTINNMNWLGREVLNIKHPERNPAETARRVATYVIGTALINTLFEDELGIQSPQPAPIKEMIRAAQRGDSNFSVAYQGLKEMTELAPFLSSLKFGSSPAGAVAEFLKELSNAAAEDLPKALNGDKEAMKRVGFVAAKLTGVPGTQQVKRLTQGTPLGFPVEKIESSSGLGARVRTKTERVKTTRVKTQRQRTQR